MLVLSANSMKSKAFDTLYKSLMYNKNIQDLKSTLGALDNNVYLEKELYPYKVPFKLSSKRQLLKHCKVETRTL